MTQPRVFDVVLEQGPASWGYVFATLPLFGVADTRDAALVLAAGAAKAYLADGGYERPTRDLELRDGEELARLNIDAPIPGLTADQYQRLALTTWKMRHKPGADVAHDTGPGMRIVYPALKLNGEAGEVAEKVGKWMRDETGEFLEGRMDPERRAALLKELGDVQWYVSTLAHELGFTLEEVMAANLDKIFGRLERDTLHGSGDDR